MVTPVLNVRLPPHFPRTDLEVLGKRLAASECMRSGPFNGERSALGPSVVWDLSVTTRVVSGPLLKSPIVFVASLINPTP